RKSQPFFGRHPWVLDSAIAKIEGTVADGDIVDLHSEKNRFIARGLYNSRSKLRVRLYTWDPGELLDTEFFRLRLGTAIGLARANVELNGIANVHYHVGDGFKTLEEMVASRERF